MIYISYSIATTETQISQVAIKRRGVHTTARGANIAHESMYPYLQQVLRITRERPLGILKLQLDNDKGSFTQQSKLVTVMTSLLAIYDIMRARHQSGIILFLIVIVNVLCI